MFDDLTVHYDENVVTLLGDYRDPSRDGVVGRSRDLRAALGAAPALFDFRETPNGSPSAPEPWR